MDVDTHQGPPQHDTPPCKHGPILAACAFDGQLQSLVEATLMLAERYRRKVRLVHAFETNVVDPTLADWPGHYYVPTLVAMNQERLLDERRGQMQDLMQSIRNAHGDVQISGQVLAGEAVKVVIADAAAQQAALVVTACSPGSYEFVPQGFSTALSLMAETPVPLLVINSERRLRPLESGFRIMVGDDLEEGSTDAVRRAYMLATTISGSKLLHLHLHSDLQSTLRESWQDLIRRVPLLKERYATPSAYLNAHQHERRLRLEARAAPYLDEARAQQVEVNIDIRSAHRPYEELAEIAREFSPDLVVFGRHRFLKRRPFLVGRVPFRAMLGLARPVLMVPPLAGWHGGHVFPA